MYHYVHYIQPEQNIKQILTDTTVLNTVWEKDLTTPVHLTFWRTIITLLGLS